VYLDEFVSDWEALYPNDKDEVGLWALEILIMSNPEEPPVISGTGGLRKIRFGNENSGKSGASRICYAYFPEYSIVLMVLAYGKSSQSDLTAGQKAGIKQYLDYTQKWLEDHAS
jgi:hypothetical protein